MHGEEPEDAEALNLDPHLDGLLQEALLMSQGYPPGISVAEMQPVEVAERLGVHGALNEHRNARAREDAWFNQYLAAGQQRGVGL